MNELPPLVVTFVFTAFGLVVGSFLNVCIYRLPLRQSIVWPASRQSEPAPLHSPR